MIPGAIQCGFRNHGDAMRNKVRSAGNPSENSERLEGSVSSAVTIALDYATKLRTILWHLTLQIQTR